ncbi:hypothetical protein CSB11_02020 [Candidatus Campbellbacteria bacterium]|nr:MAG: hypothetical protein CSB11_02020 [Candidatus Campbellbacteria bacterium]
MKKIIYSIIAITGLVFPSLTFADVDFTLNQSDVFSGSAINTLVGTFSDSSLFYSLEGESGGEDNSKFTIVNDELRLNFIPDFDNPTDAGDTAGDNTYAISVKGRVGTSTGDKKIKNFIVTVVQSPDTTPPVINTILDSSYDITINPPYFSIPTVTCTDDVDGAVTPTVTENVNTAVLGSYTVTYNCTDAAGNSAVPRTIIINIVPENSLSLEIDVPLQVLKSGMPTGYAVSSITTLNVPSGETPIYSLVSGVGDEDNSFFTIDQNLLKINFNPDYDSPGDDNSDNAYQIRIQSQVGTSTVQKSFAIQVVPENIILDDKYKCKGYGWSEGAGWVSLNCNNTASCSISDYGVNVETGGALSGYAWSPNVSWLDIAPGAPYSTARFVSNNLEGESVFTTGLRRDDDGWNGLLKYRGSNGGATSNRAYGVSRTPGGNLHGFAWSDNVIGWLGFPSAGKAYCSNMLISFTTESENGLTPQTKVGLGENLVLKWKTEGATSCKALNGGATNWTDDPVKSVSVSGEWQTHTVSGLVENTNFTLECDDGTGNKELRNLYVFVRPPEPEINFWATDTNIPYNTKAELNWNVKYAADCKAYGSWAGNKDSTAGDHQEQVGPLKDFPNYTFILTCRSNNQAEYGTQTWSEEVTVDVAKLEVSITPTRNPIPFNYPIELKLESEFSTQCQSQFDYISGQNPLNPVPASDAFTKTWYNTNNDYLRVWRSEDVKESSKYKFTFECNGEFGQYIKRELNLKVGNVPIYIED